MKLRIVALAGGVGGAKLVDGLYKVLKPGSLSVIVNTGDDFDFLGMSISPDLDTVCYTLAGINNSDTGWGRADESWNAYNNLNLLGGPSWFRLGDKDLGLNLERTRRLKAGDSLSMITKDFLDTWNVQANVIPMTDAVVSTIVNTQEYGEIGFQDYFVHRKFEPKVKGFRFKGIEQAQPAPGVIESINEADLIVICPSNPWVSIDPILRVPGLQEALNDKFIIAVSPIIGSSAVKGPAAKMYMELGIKPSALAVANQYKDIVKGLVIDRDDESIADDISELGIEPIITNTLMLSETDRKNLASAILSSYEKMKIESLIK